MREDAKVCFGKKVILIKRLFLADECWNAVSEEMSPEKRFAVQSVKVNGLL